MALLCKMTSCGNWIHQRNRVPRTAHPLHKSTFRTVSALRLRCPACPVWSPSMYKTYYVHSNAPAVQTGSQPNPSLLPCKPKHILRGSTAKRNVFPQTNSCEFSASGQGRNKRPGLIPVVCLLKIDRKGAEFDPITAIVAERAQHDQEARQPAKLRCTS